MANPHCPDCKIPMAIHDLKLLKFICKVCKRIFQIARKKR